MRVAVSDVVSRGAHRLRPRLPRLRLPRPDERVAVAEEARPRAAAPTAYRTFSHKLAPSLTALGGALAVLGAVGPWVRATEVPSEGLDPVEVARLTGFADAAGPVIALAGALALASSPTWTARLSVVKIFPAVASLAVVGLVIWRMPVVGDRIHGLADAARRSEELDLVVYHAGLGWGAWMLIAAALALFVGVSVGLLRELDVRRGIRDET